MELKIDEFLKKSNKSLTHSTQSSVNRMSSKLDTKGLNKVSFSKFADEQKSGSKKWNFMYVYVLLFVMIMFLLGGVIKLQVFEGKELYARSSSNYLRERTIYPTRGIITDSKGKILAENLPSYNVYIIPDEYFDIRGEILEDKLINTASVLQKALGEDWQEKVIIPKTEIPMKAKEYTNFAEILRERLNTYYYLQALLVISEVDNDEAIAIKSLQAEYQGMFVDDATQRHYPAGIEFSQILGYTSRVTGEDLELNKELDPNQDVGRSGVEFTYNQELSGQKGKMAFETDSAFNIVSDLELEIEKSVPGSTLVLSIDSEAQKAMYNAIVSGVDRIGAAGASGIIQDINTGEIIAMVSYPTFDNNQFIGGISQKNYDNLIKNPSLPLFNRPIASQQPPGSIFKTLVGASAIDSGKLSLYTTYYSTPNYTFTNGAPFYEYGRVGYGNINVIRALEVSSNIFFCEVVRNWDMEELVIYLDRFGIGKVTGIDLPGEMPGRMPSPSNKIKLAKTTNPWLESVWYPEGDSCNSVIGQGIASVTPIQAVNWTSAIANGGTLHTPHVVKEIKNSDGSITKVNPEPLATDVVSDEALAIIRQGMRETIVGPSGFLLWSFYGSKYSVAAKTGTAEFGALNADGRYEHTHAWTIGFFPYENPRYAFVILLEDSQKGSNSATVANDFINNFTIQE